jgi:hypothetical protein
MRQLDAFEPLGRPAFRIGAAQALQRAEVDHDIGHVQLGVKAPLFRQVAQSIEMLTPPRLAKDPDLARVCADDVHQDADQRALAGAVRTEQPEDLSSMDVERDTAERRRVAVALHEVVEREDDHSVEELTGVL